MTSLVPRLSPSQAYVEFFTFAPVKNTITFTWVQRSKNYYAYAEEGEAGYNARE